MDINTLSLRARSVLIAVVALLLFTPAAIFTLDEAYKASLTQATLQQLKLNSLMLISEFEFDNEAPSMPVSVRDEQLNLTDSGVYGYIKWQGELVWRSSSSLSIPVPLLPSPPQTGSEQFSEQDGLFIYIFTAEFAHSEGFSPVHFYVVYDKSSFDQERESFLKALWQGLLLLDALLLLSLLLGIKFLLKPLNRLNREIAAASDGTKGLVSSDYPIEITPLSSSINQLITHEKQQRERYKNSLSDLAHSLKTPLTVAKGEAGSLPQLIQPLNEIESIIQRQLKRAATQKPGWHAPIPVKAIAQQLLSAMAKVHAEQNLTLINNIADGFTLPMESTDLMEVLGNVLDNACKAANTQVSIYSEDTSATRDVIIEDDGPGIKEQDKQTLLTRGKRLDTYQEGQGIGMAVVSDIMASYGGRLAIESSASGGASIRLSFNRLTTLTGQ
ncbi:GHKL domain-containing protein [Alteromonas sediminis]|uniref:histidine kinase n=1 Tax=Alteromonas sediminis TaxID=2259342 RepID=A0A3N5Y319_9ALTE|nr:ATP-binding protein [Alteromonas sediminis]RPJ67106.1 GHKL domain-containing protein [Alteromonas sediminis]